MADVSLMTMINACLIPTPKSGLERECLLKHLNSTKVCSHFMELFSQ